MINNVFYPVPAIAANAYIADQRLTVDDTAGGVTFTDYDATQVDVVMFDVQTANCYCTVDDSAPTTSNGHLLLQGTTYTWSVGMFNAAKFIREGATSAVLHASALRI